MKEIPLSKGLIALVDDDDFEWLSKFKWHALGGRYAANRKGHKGTYRYMHKMITNFKMTDHIDGNGFNNQKTNLRFATPSQNMCNRGLQKNSTSGFKGVSFNRNIGKYRAYIKINGHQKHIGYFSDIEKAAAAYNKKALELHGEFARLNEI